MSRAHCPPPAAWALPLALSLVCAGPAQAILGEAAERALSRAGQWYGAYRAEAPRVEADEAGNAARECWVGPPGGWSLSTALQFAGELLPDEARRNPPDLRDTTANERHYDLEGGYRFLFRTMGDRIFRVDVMAPSWSGGGC